MAISNTSLWGQIDPTNNYGSDVGVTSGDWGSVNDMLSGVLNAAKDVGSKYFEFKTLEQQIREKDSVLNRAETSQQDNTNWRNLEETQGGAVNGFNFVDGFSNMSTTMKMVIAGIVGFVVFKLVK